MQLNVLKKAYTTKMSKLDHKSIESIDQVCNLYVNKFRLILITILINLLFL